MPLVVIMTAANTVSRARDSVFDPPEIIKVTMSATSMTVTAIASTSDPKGSPTRCATTSAWCTAASTAPPSRSATTATTAPGRSRSQVRTRATRASGGATVLQGSRFQDGRFPCSLVRGRFVSGVRVWRGTRLLGLGGEAVESSTIGALARFPAGRSDARRGGNRRRL